MNWSLRQLKGLVVGTNNDSGKLHTQALVLVDNLKVCRMLSFVWLWLMEADIYGPL